MGTVFSVLQFYALHIIYVLKIVLFLDNLYERKLTSVSDSSWLCIQFSYSFSSKRDRCSRYGLYCHSLHGRLWLLGKWFLRLYLTSLSILPAWFILNPFNSVASAGNQLSHSQRPAHPNVRWLWTEGYCDHGNQRNGLFHTLKSTTNQNYSLNLTGCCEVLGKKICISNR